MGTGDNLLKRFSRSETKLETLSRHLLRPGGFRRTAISTGLSLLGERVPFRVRQACDAFDYPQYAYGVYHAALQAKALGVPELSAIEFGVAGGNGLLALERVARQVTAETDVDVRVFGFDAGSGMPEASDYRDLPYVWQKGFFQMDVDALRARLDQAELVIGDVKETAVSFVENYAPPPVGFISFDLDYYSSTANAFRLFDEGNESFLPRVYCYFDDCIGDEHELHSEFTGELLLINEFNSEARITKLSRINGLRYKRIFDAGWNDVMFIAHLFEHPEYNTYINPRSDWQIPLST